MLKPPELISHRNLNQTYLVKLVLNSFSCVQALSPRSNSVQNHSDPQMNWKFPGADLLVQQFNLLNTSVAASWSDINALPMENIRTHEN